MPGYLLDKEFVDAVRRVVRSTPDYVVRHGKRGKKWRGVADDGDGAIQYAKVITADIAKATEASGDISPGEGAAQRYEWGATAEELQLITGDEIVLWNASQEVPLEVGKVVAIYEINGAWFGEYLEVADYLRALGGSGKVLFRDTAGDDDLTWESEACP